MTKKVTKMVMKREADLNSSSKLSDVTNMKF